MTKATNIVEKQAYATDMAIKGSVQKLALIAQMIRGMEAGAAQLQLEFSNKGAAKSVLKVLRSALANAEHNHDMQADNLYISRVDVGKAFVLKRFHARGRGRAAGIKKPFSKISIFVKEKR